jgi:hypothetical protein
MRQSTINKTCNNLKFKPIQEHLKSTLSKGKETQISMQHGNSKGRVVAICQQEASLKLIILTPHITHGRKLER